MSRPKPYSAAVLVVDDEESILLAIDTTLQLAGWENITTCSDSRKVEGILAAQPVDVVLLDLNMPYINGEQLLSDIHRQHPDIPVVVITGAVELETAVRCMKKGAFDYLVKPVEDNRLITTVQRAVSFRELEDENRALRAHLLTDAIERPEAFKPIITGNRRMLAIFQYIESIARTSQPVLISGETGVGKELVARALHQLSGLDGPFVAINVAGLDDNVFSDTLFGHKKGAFTGADRDRSGMIERASGGTLFLDEIGDLSAGSQVKLLRLLQENEYLPLGCDEPRRADTRIVASTHEDLWALEQQGRFRRDLIYRLDTHHVQIPSLRERLDDLPLLLDHFFAKACRTLNKKMPTAPPELMVLLGSHGFPGNVRELEAMVFDAVTRHKRGVLSLASFKKHIERNAPPVAQRPADDPALENGIRFPPQLPSIREMTRMLVEEALQRAQGNQTIAARMLGISQQALSKRLKQSGDG
jgi:DNA-binding NtrC family response regulator